MMLLSTGRNKPGYFPLQREKTFFKFMARPGVLQEELKIQPYDTFA